MKIYICMCCFLLLSNRLTIAQQNIFNIPSGDITPKGKMFYQHQLNVYSYYEYESKSHFVFGLFKNFEIGVNLVNAPILFDRGVRFSSQDNVLESPLYPGLLGTAQYQYKLSEKIFVSTGFMAGTNITNSINKVRFLFKGYGLIKYVCSQKLRLLGGAYKANQYLVGEYNQPGLLFGYEIFLSDKWILMGDYISGRNVSSSIVNGINYPISERVQFCAGMLLSTYKNNLKPGIVFELNLLGYDSNDH